MTHFPLEPISDPMAKLTTTNSGILPSSVRLREIIQHGIAFAHCHNAASSSNSPERGTPRPLPSLTSLPTLPSAYKFPHPSWTSCLSILIGPRVQCTIGSYTLYFGPYR